MLVLQLKRFEYSFNSRHKVTKAVEFQTRLNLAPYMSSPEAPLMVCPPSSGPPVFPRKERN